MVSVSKVVVLNSRSMADISDMPEDVPMKRYKPRSFAMGFGKRAAMRSFNMGFGKRSAEPQIGEIFCLCSYPRTPMKHPNLSI